MGEGGAQAQGCGAGSVNSRGCGDLGTGGNLFVGYCCFAGHVGAALHSCVAGSVCRGVSCLGNCFAAKLRSRGAEQFMGGLLYVGREGAGNSCDAGSTDGQGARGENSGGDFAGGENSEQRHVRLQNLENKTEPVPWGTHHPLHRWPHRESYGPRKISFRSPSAGPPPSKSRETHGVAGEFRRPRMLPTNPARDCGAGPTRRSSRRRPLPRTQRRRRFPGSPG